MNVIRVGAGKEGVDLLRQEPGVGAPEREYGEWIRGMSKQSNPHRNGREADEDRNL